MTIGELRKILKDKDDELEVIVSGYKDMYESVSRIENIIINKTCREDGLEIYSDWYESYQNKPNHTPTKVVVIW